MESWWVSLFSCMILGSYRISSASPEKIDLVVTLGGDGTILHASSLFSSGAVPPVLSFSLGTLGFLLPFRTFRDQSIIQLVYFVS